LYSGRCPVATRPTVRPPGGAIPPKGRCRTFLLSNPNAQKKRGSGGRRAHHHPRTVADRYRIRAATRVTRGPQRRVEMGQQHPSTWLITGCSTGFGRELARAVVARGYRAVLTARNPAQVEGVVAGHGDRALALALDVTNPAQVGETVRRAEERFGGIDVL